MTSLLYVSRPRLLDNLIVFGALLLGRGVCFYDFNFLISTLDGRRVATSLSQNPGDLLLGRGKHLMNSERT